MQTQADTSRHVGESLSIDVSDADDTATTVEGTGSSDEEADRRTGKKLVWEVKVFPWVFLGLTYKKNCKWTVTRIPTNAITRSK